MKPHERNAFIADLLNQFIGRAKSGDGPAADRYQAERKVLERLIPIQTDGFRGITLTAIMGKFVRDDINTGTEFHTIKPRGLFEKGIRPVLKQHRIPTGASAPLNVAKNIQVLDEKWAEGRDPEEAALAAVDYIRRINRHWNDTEFRDDLIMIFIQRLIAYADEVGSHDVELANIDGVPPVVLAKRLARFAVAFPERGSLPQYIVGCLLTNTRSSDTEYADVHGADESVFGTNSTSKKPADLWETLADGSHNNFFEVTCKKIDEDRLNAAVDSYAKLALPTAPITFICRMPTDAKSLNLEDGVVVYRGIPFQFLDINAFIETSFLLLTPEKRASALEQISRFIADPSRSIKTKLGWAEVFG